MQIDCVCAICGQPLPEGTAPIELDGHAVHARCFQAGEEVIGVTAAMLAEQRGVPSCAECLAAELGSGHLELRSALWHLARTLQLLPGTCRCGAVGWRLT
jgi:hypothetical protein